MFMFCNWLDLQHLPMLGLSCITSSNSVSDPAEFAESPPFSIPPGKSDWSRVYLRIGFLSPLIRPHLCRHIINKAMSEPTKIRLKTPIATATTRSIMVGKVILLSDPVRYLISLECSEVQC